MSGPGDGYDRVIRDLFGRRRFGAKLNLGRVHRGLARLGSPQKHFPYVIQIGGTNGKGSTARFVEAILTCSGVRTGLFSSPHLSHFSERFRVGAKEVSESAIVDAHRAVTGSDSEDNLTFFEICTLMGVRLFEKGQVAVAIFEVGLGGRGDATTAIGNDIAVVTGVARDHENVLGTELSQIAREKAAIFRRGGLGVVGDSGRAEGKKWLLQYANEAGLRKLSVVGNGDQTRLPSHPRYQDSNAATAQAAVRMLARLGLSISPDNMTSICADTAIPGRFEKIGNVVLDSAHNLHGAEALADMVSSLTKPVAAVCGLSGRREAKVLAPVLEVLDDVIWTRAAVDSALPPEDLARSAGKGDVVGCARSALAKAKEKVGASGTVLVFGSLHLVGEIRGFLIGRDADGLQDPPSV